MPWQYLTHLSDNFVGGAEDNSINGLMGNDVINGMDGDDKIIGGMGNDTLNGGDDDDFLIATTGYSTDALWKLSGNDIFNGGQGDDRIYTGSGTSTVDGGSGNDVIHAAFGDNQIDGGSGVDKVSFTPIFLDTLVSGGLIFSNQNGGAGDVVVDLAAGTSTVTWTGPDGVEVFNSSLTSIENIRASNGDDSLTGDNNANVIEGWYGDDSLFGGGGNDELFGGQDNDIIDGGSGDDLINGGSGVDTFVFESAGDVTVNLEHGTAGGILGNDTLVSIENVKVLNGDDTVVGDDKDNIVHSKGGDDLIVAGEGDDSVYGGTGNDTLLGGAGDDNLYGQWDDDTFRGGSGDDYLVMGPGGTDTVVWGNGDANGMDTIFGFEAGTDQLVFHDGFLATSTKRGGQLEDHLEVLQAEDAADSILRANTSEAGWQTLATFENVSSAELVDIVANDTSVHQHGIMFEIV